MLTDKLQLSLEQQVQVKQVMEKTRQEVIEVSTKMHGVFSDIRSRSIKSIMDVLGAEQKEKFKAFMEKKE